MINSFRCDLVFFWIVNDVPYLMEGTWIEKKINISSNNDSEFLSGGECDTISMIQNFSNIWPFITQIFSASHNCPICCQIVQYCVLKFSRAIYFGKYAEKKSLKVWYFLPSGALPCTAFVIGMATFGQSMPLFLINNSIIDPLNSTPLLSQIYFVKLF